MSLTIDLAPEDEARLDDEARERGVSLSDFIGEVLRRHIHETNGNGHNGHSRPSLLDEWEAQDEGMTEEEIRREDDLWERFQLNVNETRVALGMRLL